MKVESTIDQLLNPVNIAVPQKRSSDIMGKEDFLRLLITQLKYQNPLEPLESQEFASQLAQFSSLEQLSTLNETMAESQAANIMLINSISNAMAAGLIGKRMLAESDMLFHVEGRPDLMQFNLADLATSVKLRIVNSAGIVIYEEDLGAKTAGNNSFVWDGMDKNGNMVADGEYRFEIETVGVDGESVPSALFTTGVISAVRYRNGEAFLIVNNVEIPLREVREILNGI